MESSPATDREILAAFAKTQDERCIKELMERHLNMVFSTALRSCGSREIAADVTQDAFLKLIEFSAVIVKKDVAPAAWLHRTARLRALDLLRGEKSRKNREAQFSTMDSSRETLPAEALELLDRAIDKLSAIERELVLQRYFSGLSLRSIGAQHRLSEDAARMRLSRALGKIRSCLAAKGFATTTALLAGTLASEAAEGPSAAIAARITARVLSFKHLAAAAQPSTPFTILHLMTTTKKGALAIALLIGAGATAVIVSKTNNNSSGAKEGTSVADSSSTQPASNPAADSVNRSRTRQEDDKSFADLNDKYGAQQTRLALKAAGAITSLSEVYYSSLTPDEKTRQEKATEAMEYLAETLQLDEEHGKAIAALSDKYAEATKAREAALVRRGRDNVKQFAETLLALDAWKQGKTTEGEFEEVFDRNWPQLSVDGESILEGSEFYSQSIPETDPLQNMDQLAGEVSQLLPQEAADRYREMRSRNAEAAGKFTFTPKTVEEVAKFADDSKRLIEAMQQFGPGDK